MSDLFNIRALTFDVFGTTVDWCAGIAREAEALLGPKGHRLDWVAFANRWRKEYQPAMEQVRSGKRGYVAMDVLHREMLDVALKEFGVTDLTAGEKDQFALAWRRLPPWADTVEGMTRLKRTFVLVALSNGNIALISEMAKRGGLPWDVILGADIVQTYKPMPALYDSAPRMLDLKPEQVMMVACHAWDLDHAMKRGLRTAYVRRADEYGPGAGLPEPKPGTYDLQVGSFVELAEAMGA
ncbi:MAG: haloacid dehalogenase type II [Hyphomonadaceae bacterium]